jgi:hypothetical protein
MKDQFDHLPLALDHHHRFRFPSSVAQRSLKSNLPAWRPTPLKKTSLVASSHKQTFVSLRSTQLKQNFSYSLSLFLPQAPTSCKI